MGHGFQPPTMGQSMQILPHRLQKRRNIPSNTSTHFRGHSNLEGRQDNLLVSASSQRLSTPPSNRSTPVSRKRAPNPTETSRLFLPYRMDGQKCRDKKLSRNPYGERLSQINVVGE